MDYSIKRVAVLGAGTMGAAIAAHAANAGLPVLLLDRVPTELEPEEEKRGLTLDSPEVRNRIVRRGLEAARKIKPPSFMGRDAERLVEVGNFDDDLGKLADADWIVEAVVERIDVKRALFERVDAVRRPGTPVTTNTSGLPIHALAEGRSDDFRRHFFGTHFFNPPRYMHLLEIIRGEEADPLAVSALAELATQRLGKGVVFCKDTPNFIANRILAIHSGFVMEYALENGYRIEEVDAVTGPLIGRPKTATFRLHDLVGIDVAHHVAENLYDLIPDDFYRAVLQAPRSSTLIGELVDRGWLGNKSGQGFYRKTKQGFLVLDPESFDYREQEPVELESVEAVREIPELGERLRTLFSDRWRDADRGAELAWAAVRHFLAYAAEVAMEVAYDLQSVDAAVRWGFGYELGPFELWDRLGVAETAERMEASGIEVADWVKEMLFAEIDAFYRVEEGLVTGYYDWNRKAYADRIEDELRIPIAELRQLRTPLASNRAASLHDLDDGVLLLEFHSKMNTLSDDTVALMTEALRILEGDAYYGLVIGNDAENFSIGADLRRVGEAALGGDFDAIRAASKALQEVLQGFRYSSKPVVAAVRGMALGGGAEVALGVTRIVAHAESYLGLVESGVGLVPAGGGLLELVRRVISPAMAVAEADPLPLARRLLETVAMAKVSSSAAEAREMGFLGPHDRIVMHRDHLIYEAKQEVLTLVADGYMPPPPARLYAGGRDLYAALRIVIWSLEQAGYASAHDALVAGKIAFVLAGGDLSAPAWVAEEHFLELEREAFAELAATAKTQERIRHMLETGKPLRN